MLFEFFMNFLNIERKKKHFFGGGGGGGGKKYLFFRKTILYHIISRFMLYPTFKNNAFCEILKSAPLFTH